MTVLARVRPILKWAGGKQALAARLVERFPRGFRRYYEPFVGGASVLLELAPPRAVVGDLNEWLLWTYEAVRRDWRRVARELDSLRNTREEFLRVRAIDPRGLSPARRAAHLIYLNKTCFRGLFRVNRDGRFNVPFGNYRRRFYDRENLRAFAERLAAVEIRCADFEAGVEGAGPRDFVYLDPPYYKLGGYADFNRYTAGRFEVDDHRRLARLCADLDRRGVRWALSQSDTPFTRELFARFRIEAIESRREICLDPRQRGARELLVLNR